MARRKALYEQHHPETRHGGDRRSRSQITTLKHAAFIDDTAGKTGKHRATVSRDARRKVLYEQQHPETRHGGAPGKAGGGKRAKVAKLAGFVADASKKTGKPERGIQRDAHRGAAIPSQRALVAARMANMPVGRNWGNSANLPDKVSQAAAARLFNVSERSVRSAARMANMKQGAGGPGRAETKTANWRFCSVSQAAAARAMIYPEPATLKRKGAGISETEKQGVSNTRLSVARAVLRHPRARALAMIYPEPSKGGRGNKQSLAETTRVSNSRLTQARAVLRHSRTLALAMIYPEPEKGGRGIKGKATETGGFSQSRLKAANLRLDQVSQAEAARL